MKNVLICYPFTPNYRLPIFNLLNEKNSDDLNFTFVSGFTADTSIKILSFEDIN